MVNGTYRRTGVSACRRNILDIFRHADTPARRYADTRRPTGQASLEFILMLSFLTFIGILIMSYMTNQGSAGNAIGSGQNKAIDAIQNN